jgi:hypothetical protein
MASIIGRERGERGDEAKERERLVVGRGEPARRVHAGFEGRAWRGSERKHARSLDPARRPRGSFWLSAGTPDTNTPDEAESRPPRRDRRRSRRPGKVHKMGSKNRGREIERAVGRQEGQGKRARRARGRRRRQEGHGGGVCLRGGGAGIGWISGSRRGEVSRQPSATVETPFVASGRTR